MQTFEMSRMLAERAAAGRLYREFLRVPALSAGVYVLPAGGADPQQPHNEDEIYYVVGGRATVRVGDEERAVAPGAFIYVGAGVPHHFHTILEELALLVVFAPVQTRRV
jgi:mannose-6-phosphate isomerase-like protein (cupin superfamily)